MNYIFVIFASTISEIALPWIFYFCSDARLKIKTEPAHPAFIHGNDDLESVLQIMKKCLSSTICKKYTLVISSFQRYSKK